MQPEQPLNRPDPRWSPLALLPKERHRVMLLLILSTAIYLPILFNGLVWDADLLIRHDPRLRDLSHAFDYFRQGLWGFDANQAVDYYRPLIGLLHTLEYAFFATNPLGYNLVNLLLNTGVCLLAYQLLTRWLSSENAFWGAALYASLPVRTEVVYWTYSDSHLLVAIFILLSVIAFLDDRPAASFLCFVLALLTQEVAVVLPAILLVIALHKKTAGKSVLPLAAAFIGMLLYLGVRTMVLGSGFLKKAAAVNDPQLMLYLLAKYLKILFLQDAAITLYARDPRTLPDFLPFSILGAILLAGGLILAWTALRRNHQNLVWLAWFSLLMLPTFLIGRTGAYYMAEKPLFLASLGIIALLIKAIKAPNRLLVSAIVLVIFANSFLTCSEGKYWKSTETYLEKALEFDDTFILGLAGLGDAYYARGDYDSALKCYQKIVKLNPWHLGAIKSIRQIEAIKRGLPLPSPAQ
jgi:tetratricopeptide (TPR) repeat protein